MAADTILIMGRSPVSPARLSAMPKREQGDQRQVAAEAVKAIGHVDGIDDAHGAKHGKWRSEPGKTYQVAVRTDPAKVIKNGPAPVHHDERRTDLGAETHQRRQFVLVVDHTHQHDQQGGTKPRCKIHQRLLHQAEGHAANDGQRRADKN